MTPRSWLPGDSSFALVLRTHVVEWESPVRVEPGTNAPAVFHRRYIKATFSYEWLFDLALTEKVRKVLVGRLGNRSVL